MTDGELQRRWNERASEDGASLQGVLFRGFSPQLNQYIHEWHVSAVTTQLLPHLPRQALVLDLGCGYGRIRQHVIQARPDLRIVGTDFSENYCRLHAKTFEAETVCADIRRLPFRPGIFDGIVGVTCLMYLADAERTECLQRLITVLKPSGYALFIDPGFEFMRLARVAIRSTRSTPTGGTGFLLSDYLRLGSAQGLGTLSTGGLPWFTLLLPLLHLIRRHTTLTGRVLSTIRRADITSAFLQRYSLQRWVLLKRA